ncbi:PPPDE putative peptidase domain-containing protein [Cantharellus anzutake]|uniref:PPPDE putative peptidase domain-containing protein n=1 Tax=Cantharellus anzutake TaxID=1750568 RepID=UPI0019078F76|nr:PPPDE putative peptidase domain-containing protein [Cantharellus anzutake]XP_038913588.1 PPPDE putative peptidase domain-containing protein [Cantharellus anzutake]KAF8318355.1 PPPDE putative peptidase domain-containing protein [Cantharellus anzutake]KAF8327480.1 PPPDE putative peptidase domain-containing protein [Cantharellus anzutake]
MGRPVKLFVYDLSRGMARAMSPLTGGQIDGIWHTSVVAFGKEIHYGPGIVTSAPGTTFLGSPLHVYDMGETEIDQATYDDYIDELRGHYTAEKYHLLEFNCNSFTNDVVGFLTGGTIPAHIRELPAQFLSTPLGQQMRPMIDSMYRRAPPSAVGVSPPQTYPAPAQTPSPSVGSSLLQNVAARAVSGPAAAGTQPSLSSLSSHLLVSTNLASFESILEKHRGVIALFVQNLPSEKKLEVAFEALAKEKANLNRVAFVSVDASVGNAKDVIKKWNVGNIPSVLCLLKGEKISESALPSIAELRAPVEGFLNTAFPPHPHRSLELPATRAISLSPILFSQVPTSIDVPITRLTSIIDAKSNRPAAVIKAKSTLTSSFSAFLKQRFPPGTSATSKSHVDVPVTTKQVKEWSEMTSALADTIPPVGLFPLVDLWRLAVLDNRLASTNAPAVLQKKISGYIDKSTNPGSLSDVPKPVLLTILRLAANTFAFPNAATASREKSIAIPVLVAGLLHSDSSVRSSAASVAFNIAAARHASVKDSDAYWDELARREVDGSGAEDAELACALLEAIEREKESEDVVHRLVASLALLVYLSPSYSPDSNEVGDMLEVLDAKQKILSKLEPSGFGAEDSSTGISKQEVRKLVEEVGGALCP